MAIPISRSALACGDRRTVTRTPSPATINGPSDKVFEHQVARKPQDQDQDHWRDVDSTEIRENTPDRPEHRLRNPPQKIPDRGDGAVVAVNDAESHEPAQHRLGNQQPDIDRDHRAYEVYEGIHLRGNLGGKWLVTVTSADGVRKARRTGATLDTRGAAHHSPRRSAGGVIRRDGAVAQLGERRVRNAK